MIYLSVVKNESGDWVILKTITYPINIRGNKTGNTYGDISKLDLDTRRDEGFWTQNDVYQNTGEFMIFKEKVVTFDEDAVEVTNTYIYERMPLDDIKTDLLGRVTAKRDSMYYNDFTFDGHSYNAGSTSRANIQLFISAALIDESNFPSSIELETVDGVLVPFDLVKFKQLVKELFDYTSSLYIKERTIKAAISAAEDYDTVRDAAKWDDEIL
ncbi:putative structural protein [Erwinia phage pEa_SNUABM_50]|uniref:DUF4376 domain-containing protein n=4 Tax=Eneladusvirus BF TaxID=2560751 RepID=A0A1S6UBF7_9CAUD|nr:virion structural protein [Serratia phage BF]QOI71161.1 putative structural protein [Erwinia phage pEa_SNUABM_12]QOI71705.1 putative structural protein [Erwinia phage pEa_SNUABM_47]QOI72244.1 putative structural protein [Erwinia phage pEa_SNUABM_50]QXO11370.1 hypothetical protein pEaSNUABM19_00224 [Erwinia phage pEa_SNUABM_19]QXO11918.1 hypothetical protein pEaSNUABM44_00222 [Erwinia phage pEa_SNUABM_44]